MGIKEKAKEVCDAWGMEDNHGYGVKETFQVGFVQGAREMNKRAIEAFNEAMIYFQSPACQTEEEALKHFIDRLEKEFEGDSSEIQNNQKTYTGKICGGCNAFSECVLSGAEHNDVACPGFDDSCLSDSNGETAEYLKPSINPDGTIGLKY